MRPKPGMLPSQASQLAMLIICSDQQFVACEAIASIFGQLSSMCARVRKVVEVGFDASQASQIVSRGRPG